MAVALNKVDQIKPKERLLGLLADCAARWPGVELVPDLGAHRRGHVDALLSVIRNFLPRVRQLFPEDQLSTASVRFLASEIIREKLFLALDQELPYNIAVEIETWEELPEQNMTMIGAMIYTSKNSHKGMIVGKQGQNLKAVGQQARQELKVLLGTKVHWSFGSRCAKGGPRMASL
jgi:GTPase